MAAGSVVVSITPELDPYYPAQEVRVSIEVLNINGNPTDPGALTLTVRKPDETEYLIDILSMAHDSTGHYHYDVLLDMSYEWRWRVESGGPDAADEGDISVSGTVFDTALPAPVGPGTGHEGEIARVTGGVYQPYAGSADEQPLVWRTGTGWVGQALNLAAAAAVSGLLALTHVTPGSPGQVLTTDGGGNVTWAAGGGGSGVPGGASTNLQYNNAGSFDGAASINVNGSENALQFSAYGAAPIYQRNSAATQYVPLIVLDNLTGGAIDGVRIGHSSLVGGIDLDSASGSQHRLRINNVTEYTFTSTLLDLKDGGGAGNYVRAAYGTSGFRSRNLADSADIPLLALDNLTGGATDGVRVGSSSVGGFDAEVAAGAQFRLRINNTTEYTFDATTAAFGANNLTFTTGFIQQGANPAGAGDLRTKNIYSWQARNYNNTGDVNVVGLTGDGSTFTDLNIGSGDATGNNALYLNAKSFVRIDLLASAEYVFTTTQITMNANNIVGAGYVSSTGTVAGSGFVRAGNNSTVVAARNAGDTADITVLFVGSNDNILIGGSGTPVNPNVFINSLTTTGIRVSGTAEYIFDATQFDMLGNNLLMGAGFINFAGTAAAGGNINTPHNVVLWAGRNQAGSATISLLNFGGSGNNNLDIGGAGTAIAANLGYGVATGGAHTFSINNSAKLTLDADKVLWANTGTAPSSNPSGGIYLWAASAQSFRARSSAGVEEHLTAVNGGTTTGTAKRVVRRENRVQTTNATFTTIDSFASFPDDTVGLIIARIVARNTTTAEQNTYFIRQGVRRRGGGAPAMIGTAAADQFEEQATWDYRFNISSNDVQIQVAGAASQTIEWWVYWEFFDLTP